MVDTIDDALRQPGAAEGLWGLLGDIAGGAPGYPGCPGVRLLLCSAAPVSLGDGAAITCIEVGGEEEAGRLCVFVCVCVCVFCVCVCRDGACLSPEVASGGGGVSCSARRQLCRGQPIGG